MTDSIPKEENRGGYRPNAGRKKGGRNQETILKRKIAAELTLQNQLVADIKMLLPIGIRKHGVAALKDISKEEIEKEIERRIGHNVHHLINAQLSIALGTQHLYKVMPVVQNNGKIIKKHVLVTDSQEIGDYLDDPTKLNGSDYFYITARSPDNTAITAVLDRLLGKTATKIVGANNADGSEGPIKVIVANFDGVRAYSPAQTLTEHIIQDAIDEDNGTTNPS